MKWHFESLCLFLFWIFQGFIFSEIFVGLKHSVEQMKDSSEVARIFTVVKEVITSSAAKRNPVLDCPRPVVSAMTVFTLYYSKNQPNNYRENMNGINSG